jgi:hypothetical protein
MRNENKILIRKSVEKKQLRLLKRRWEDNIRKYFKEIEWGNVERIHVPEDGDRCHASVNTEINLLPP